VSWRCLNENACSVAKPAAPRPNGRPDEWKKIVSEVLKYCSKHKVVQRSSKEKTNKTNAMSNRCELLKNLERGSRVYILCYGSSDHSTNILFPRRVSSKLYRH